MNRKKELFLKGKKKGGFDEIWRKREKVDLLGV